MRVPTKNPNAGLGTIRNTNSAPLANAEHFGAANWRDLYNLGQAGLGAGNAVLAQAQRKAQEEDETQVRIANSAMRSSYKEQIKILQDQYRGNRSPQLPEQVDKLMQQVREQASANLTNSRQRKAFDQAAEVFATQSRVSALEYRDGQMEIAKQESIATQNQLAIEAGAEAALGPGGIDAALSGGYLQVIESNLRTQTHGLDEDTKQLKIREGQRAFHKEMIKNLETQGPEAALAYLDDDRVKGAFTTAEREKLREKYQKAAIEAEQKQIVNQGVGAVTEMIKRGAKPSDVYLYLISQVGTETAGKIMAGHDKWSAYAKAEDEEIAKVEKEWKDAEEKRRTDRQTRGDEVLTASAKQEGRAAAGTMSLSALREYAYANFPEKYAEILLSAADAEQKAKDVDTAAAAIERENKLGQELKGAGYNAVNMPSYASMTPNDQEKWLKLGNNILNKTTQKQEADESYYLQVQFDMPDSELAAIFADPKQRQNMVDRLGGVDSQLYKNVASRIEAIRKGGGSGSGDAAEKFNSLDSILNNLKTEANIVFANTGRFTGAGAGVKSERDDATNRVVSYARKEFEASMQRHDVNDINMLPLEERNRIFSEALVSHETGGILGSNPVTAAEAWSRGIDVTDAEIIRETLPAAYRRDIVPGGTIKTLPGENTGYIQTEIPLKSAPLEVRIAAERYNGVIMRTLGNRDAPKNGDGNWLVASPQWAAEFTADGKDELLLDPKEVAALVGDYFFIDEAATPAEAKAAKNRLNMHRASNALMGDRVASSDLRAEDEAARDVMRLNAMRLDGQFTDLE